MYIREYRPNEVIDGRYRVEALIGKGGFSFVYRVFDTRENQGPLALKMIANDPTHHHAMLEGLNNDFAKLSLASSCSYIIRPIRLQNRAAPFYSVLTYVDGHSLSDYMHDNGPLPEELIARCLFQIGTALEQCHDLEDPLIHLDVKPENILLDRQGNCFLSDFGTARHLSELEQDKVAKDAFTPNYVPPEVFRKAPLSTRSDIFSLGVSLYEFCTGLHDPEAMPLSRSINLRMDLDPIPDRYSKRIAQLIEMMLKIRPQDRPSASLVRNFGEHFLEHGFWMDPQGRSTQFISRRQAEPAPPPPASAPPAPVPSPVEKTKKTPPAPSPAVIRHEPKPNPIPAPAPHPPNPVQLAQRARQRQRLRRFAAAAAVILLLSVSSILFLNAQASRFAALEQEVYTDMARREYREAFDRVEAAAIPFHGNEVQQLASEIHSASEKQVENLRNRFIATAKSEKPDFQSAELVIDSLQKCAVANWAALQDEFRQNLQFEQIKLLGMQQVDRGEPSTGKQTLERAADMMYSSATIEVDPIVEEKLRELIRKGY